MINSSLAQRFEDPPREYGPTPLWWWSGAPVTREGIRWQMQRFAEGGIDNLVVMNLAPKGPAAGAKPDEPAWFSEEWWGLFEYACEVGNDLGSRLWFYDQIGFSGANIQGQITAKHPHAAGQNVHSRTATVGPAGELPLEPREHLIGVFGQQEANGCWPQLEWNQGRTAAAPGDEVHIITWEERAFDYLNPAAVRLLMDFVHGEFDRRVGKYLGNVIAGSFQDELPAMPTWSKTFLLDFQRIAGYDLYPQLPSLWIGDAEVSARVRFDYQRVRAQLAQDAFFSPLADWHNRRGMLLGADQFNPARAGWPTQGTQLYADYFATHRWYSAAGSDHEGDARIHSSMADLYDHPRVWVESFHSSGWGSTLEDTWDWLIPFFRSGANLYNPHASYYSLRAGWFEWAPPGTDFRQPYYEVYKDFSRAVARVSAMLTWGRHVVDTAVLYPSATIQSLIPPDLPVDHFGPGWLDGCWSSADETQSTYVRLVGVNNWFRSAPGVLDQLGHDFDIIDEDSIRRSVIANGAVSVTGFAFRTLILPSADYLTTETAQRLIEFLDDGGRVIAVGRQPKFAAGFESDDESVRRLAEHPSLIAVSDPDDVIALLGDQPPHAWSDFGIRAQRDGDSVVAFVPSAYPNASGYPLIEDPASRRWDDYDFDAGRYSKQTELRVDSNVTEAEIWNPATGERRATAVRREGDASYISVDFDGAPALLVAWQEGTSVGPRMELPTLVQRKTIDLSHGWVQRLVPTLDNRWGDFALPPSSDAVPLEIWKLDWNGGGDQSTPVRVTYGQEVLTGGPWLSDRQPPVLTTDETALAIAGGPLHAGEDPWSVHRFSLSRGVEKDDDTPLGPKGFVPEEFVRQPHTGLGESAGVRALIKVPHAGEYVLTIGASATKRVWINGVEVLGDDEPFAMSVPISVDAPIFLLEYRLGENEAPFDSMQLRERTLASYFTIDEPGRRVPRPEFIRVGDAGAAQGPLFRKRFTLPDAATSVQVITGCATALTLEIDGQPVARQEKVEYYESATRDPMFFLHQLNDLGPGEHEVSVTVESLRPGEGVYVDLVYSIGGVRSAVVSDNSWSTATGGTPAMWLRSLSGRLTHARAAVRPHPLAAAHWLVGAPEIGILATGFEASLSTTPRLQKFRFQVPAGTTGLELPLEVSSAAVSGEAVDVGDGRTLSFPVTSKPSVVELVAEPRSFSVGAAAWTGPAQVHTTTAPVTFGGWPDLGIGSWSGGVAYQRRFHLKEPTDTELDLGDVRGAVTVELDGKRVGAAFCGPYRFAFGDLSAGEHDITVTLYSTLAERFDSASPSTWIYPSQLVTGIFGPVRLVRKLIEG